MTELDELSTFAGSFVMNTYLKHPLDPHLYPKIVDYTAKVSIEVQGTISSKIGSCSGKWTHVF